ncbi:hypothetical protein [Shewanella fodinae]|uniref:hypothetical protein n=1 Tax=Shewanella fodinae TaxID=552357 RepID=UPI001679C063|nr:hypothetical protein [Shewanella fodinae]MCL2906219.1 hypothetical protein [Shewanella fodinae]
MAVIGRVPPFAITTFGKGYLALSIVSAGSAAASWVLQVCDQFSSIDAIAPEKT